MRCLRFAGPLALHPLQAGEHEDNGEAQSWKQKVVRDRHRARAAGGFVVMWLCWRYASCGFAGDPWAVTPYMDRLAAQGVNCINTTACTPVCAAHRASLFTGTFQSSHCMVTNELRLSPDHECLGHVLTRAGYETDAQTDLAIDFLRRSSQGDAPFALFVSWGPPHDPWSPDNVPADTWPQFRDAPIEPRPNVVSFRQDPYAAPT